VEKCGTARDATGYNIIWHIRFACCITKATDTHSEYTTVTAYTQQQWLLESPLCDIYTALVFLVFSVYYKFVNYRRSSVGVATLLRVGRPRNRDFISSKAKKFFSTSQSQDRPGTPPNHLKNWVPACLSRGGSRAARTCS